jgi:xanthine dehydrogenase YagT iron-sulfur-binding subunit
MPRWKKRGRNKLSMKKSISLRVNGADHQLDVEPRTTLLDVVRERLGLTGAKLGCDIQVCGACTLLVDGQPVSACTVLAVDADGRSITTIEGLAQGDELHPIQKAFMEFGALQCGYCTSGFILTAKALFDENSKPSEQEMRDYLAGNFCRCGCYQEIMQALKNVRGEG